ncbi:acyl-CoA carboxylase subunit beta [uncultured Cloacibacillus sp.]|uniref:acyl-CoA carboxylase subunit beta n=1 Tax=uncultured Cloacibacillus sp. TaxID=889794 RepID=UPI00320A0938
MLDLKAHIMLQGGQERINKQHAKGKLTARERVDLLFDPGTFVEYNMFVKPRATRFGMDKVDAPADGIVTGHGLINGRRAFVYSQDATVLGGSMGEMHGLKLARMQELALEAGVPIIGLNDSGGGRLQEGPGASVYGTVFYNNVNASGVIPQISAIMGSCAGGACYSPALTDFVIMVDKSSKAFITGPKVIQQVTGEVVDLETLGGAATHSTKSGLCQLVARDDYDCIAQIKCLLSFFPDNCTQMPPVYQCGDDENRRIEELNDIIPDNKRKSYDMKSIITKIADDNFFFEISPMYARNIIIGFVRMGGMPVGVVANQPGCMAGCLDINASCKAARFIRTCDAFNIPLLSIVDVPGYLPGVQQEHDGIIRHGAKMLYAWAEATVPKIIMPIRKSYGGATPAMCSIDMHADFVMAWPTCERAVVGADAAVAVLYKNEIEQAADPAAAREMYKKMYEDEFLNPYRSAELGKFEDVIEPAESRKKIIQTLRMFWGRKKQRPARKHGNIPL